MRDPKSDRLPLFASIIARSRNVSSAKLHHHIALCLHAHSLIQRVLYMERSDTVCGITTMKDSCGFCSTFLESGEVMKESHANDKRMAYAGSGDDSITQVESIVGSPSKLDSIVEAKEEAESIDAEEKKEEEAGEPLESDKDEVAAVVGDELKIAAVGNDKAKGVASNPVDEITVTMTTETTTLERDFDKNPTDLYLSLMRKDWSAAIRRCAERPDEAKTWIYRREATGTLRWKLLPIHASIIFNAPVPVIDSILHAFAEGAACKDDQGMVPLHLAIRMNSDQAVVEKLVTAQPDSVLATDRKGRTPRALAEKQAVCPKTLLVIQTLENAGSVSVNSSSTPKNNKVFSAQAIARAATNAASRFVSSPSNSKVAFASPKAAAEAKKMAANNNNNGISSSPKNTAATSSTSLQAEFEQMKSLHIQEVEKLTREASAKQIQLTARIEVLEKAAVDDKNTINSLEHKMKTTDEREFDLQSKITDMEATVAETIKDKNFSEESNKAVITNLVSQVGNLQNKLTAMTASKEASVTALADYEEASKQEMARLKFRSSENERQLLQVTFIKEKTDKALVNAEKVIVQQKGQIAKLQENLTDLSKKLATTESKLEEVTISEQELAWENNALSEKMNGKTAAAMADGGTINSNRVKALEREREDLRDTVNKLSVKLYKVVGFLDEMVQEQEAIITETMTRDSDMLGTSGTHDQQDHQQSEDRHKLLSNVAGMKEQIIGVIDSVIDGMPQTVDDDVVDQVCTTLKAESPEAVLQ